MLLRHLMTKRAETELIDQREEDLGLTRALAASVGRLQALPTGAMLFPTQVTKVLDAMPAEEAQKVVDLMRKKYPGKLDDVRVNLGGGDLKDTIMRSWNNERRLPVIRHIEALTSPVVNEIQAALGRADHFNPMSNTIGSFTNDPGVLAHELGHAVDMNDIGDRYGRLARHLYERSRMIPGLDLVQEYRASRNAIDAVGDDPAAEDAFWSTLAPAFGTYAGGFGAFAHQKMNPTKKNKVLNRRNLAYVAGGALAGHGVAALRNALAERSRKKKKGGKSKR